MKFSKQCISEGNTVVWAALLAACLAPVCLTSASVTPARAQASAPPDIVIISDITKSMYGKIKGVSKLQAMRKAVAGGLERLSPDTRVGLIGFGENPKRRCDDVADLVPPSAIRLSKRSLNNAMQKMAPKSGKSAQMAALRRAAALLSSPGAKKAVIFTDGADDCAADVCAEAAAFKAAHPNFSVDVIALNVNAAARAKVACVATKTGGNVYETRTADETEAALIAALAGRDDAETAVAAVKPGPAAAAAPVIEAPPLPERKPGGEPAITPDAAPPAAQAEAETNITLMARLAPGSDPLDRGVAWRVYASRPGRSEAAGLSAFSDEEPLWSGAGAEPRLLLAPGRYLVQAAYGFATAAKTISVAPDQPLAEEITLNAGSIEAIAVAAPGGEPLEQVFFAVVAEDAKAPGGWRQIGGSSLSKAVFHVPSGRYRVRAEHGHAQAETSVLVEPGRVARAEVAMNSGLLKLQTNANAGRAPLRDIFYYVYDANEGSAGKGKEIARSAAIEPSFRLAGGRYRVVARYGLAETEQTVTIAAGKETIENLIIEGGALRLISRGADGSEIPPGDIQYSLYKLAADGAPQSLEIGRAISIGKKIFLSSGRYRAQSKLGHHNAVETAEIMIENGKSHTLQFDHNPARVKLALVHKPGGPPSPRARWTLKTADGAVVLSTSQPSPELILKPGRYEALCQMNNKSHVMMFEAAGNEAKTVEVLAK